MNLRIWTVQGHSYALRPGLTWIWMLHCLPSFAWADGNLAEAAVQLDKMMEHPNQSQPNPGLRADESPCSSGKFNRQRPSQKPRLCSGVFPYILVDKVDKCVKRGITGYFKPTKPPIRGSCFRYYLLIPRGALRRRF